MKNWKSWDLVGIYLLFIHVSFILRLIDLVGSVSATWPTGPGTTTGMLILRIVVVLVVLLRV